jgi:hypothetical protein
MGCCKSKNTRNCKPKGKLYEIVSCTPCCQQPQAQQTCYSTPPQPQPQPQQHQQIPLPLPIAQPQPQLQQIQMIPINQYQLPFNSQIQFNRQPTNIIYQQSPSPQQQQQFIKPFIQLPLTPQPQLQPQQIHMQTQPIAQQHITVPLLAQPQFIQTHYQYQPYQQYTSIASQSMQQQYCNRQQQTSQCVQPICTLVLKPYKQDKCSKKLAKKCAKKAKKNNKCLKC